MLYRDPYAADRATSRHFDERDAAADQREREHQRRLERDDHYRAAWLAAGREQDEYMDRSIAAARAALDAGEVAS